MSQTPPLRTVNSSSCLPRRKACPGSAHAEAHAPDLGDNKYSEEGTLLHGHDADESKSRESLTQEQVKVLTSNKWLRTEFLERELPRLGISPEAKCVIIKERQFVLCDEAGDPVISHGNPVVGHPDLIYWYPEFLVAIIFDSKFGRIPVEPAWTNLQLQSYFVMFCERFQPETVIVAITQPFAEKPNDFHSAEYSAKDAPAFKRELIAIVRATEPEDAPRFASIEACTYCAAAGVCPVAITAISETSVVKINDLTPEQLEDIGEDVRLARLVIDHWEKRMKYLAENFPSTLKRYALKPTGTVRDFPDTGKVWEAVVDTTILGATEFKDQLANFLSLCKLSAAEFEGFIAKQRKITTKEAAAMMKEALGPLMIETEKAKSLKMIAGSVHEKKEAA